MTEFSYQNKHGCDQHLCAAQGEKAHNCVACLDLVNQKLPLCDEREAHCDLYMPIAEPQTLLVTMKPADQAEQFKQ